MIRILICLLALFPSQAFAITNAQALTDADAYIATHRKGQADIRIVGLPVGSPVVVKQIKSDFHFGAAVHEGYQLDSSSYASRFDLNFNTVVAGGPGYWSQTDGANKMGEVHKLYEYAQSRGHYTRLHNLIYENDQPSWVKQLGNTAMRNAISDRIDYYFNDDFDEIDIYNESWNKGEQGGSGTYWNRLGVSGISSIYNESATAASGKVFVNDYGALQGGHEGYAQHIEKLIAAGGTVEGIGVEYYSDSGSSNIPSQFRDAFDRLDNFGKPIVVSEFGLFDSANPTALRNALRIAYGHEYVTGFHLWDWTDLDPWSFAEAGALYRVNGSTYTITESGKAWQDLLGIQDHDGNPNNGWRTNLTLTASMGGLVGFNGYHGTYEVTAGGKKYLFDLTKGTTDYVLGAIPGDFNFDAIVDAADYTTWRDRSGSIEDYNLWKSRFGEVQATSVPEPATGWLILGALMVWLLVQGIADIWISEIGHVQIIKKNNRV